MTTRIVADWYLVQEIGPNIFWIKEPSIEFPVQVKNAIEIYQSGGALPLAIWPKDSIFEEGHIYVIKDVELVIRSN